MYYENLSFNKKKKKKKGKENNNNQVTTIINVTKIPTCEKQNK